MARLTLEEAVCLTLGVEPKHFSGDLFEKIRKHQGEIGPVARFLVRRHEQMRRKFNPFDHNNNVEPKLLMNWIKGEQIDVHPEFIEYFERHLGPDIGPAVVQTDAFTGDKRQLNSISKLITAMAIDGYGYVPGDARSPIPKEIEDIAARLGLNLGNV